MQVIGRRRAEAGARASVAVQVEMAVQSHEENVMAV
jgi:hypothetical protein